MTTHYNRKTNKAFFAIITLACTLLATSLVVGGTLKKEFDLGNFTGIQNNTFGQVQLVQAKEASITVETTEELLDQLDLEVKSGKLILKFREEKNRRSINLFKSKQLIFRIATPSINSIASHGSGSINAGALHGEDMRIGVHGSGEITVGNLQFSSIGMSVHGSGELQTGPVASNSVQIGIHGSGDVTGESFDIDGNGSISIHGSGDMSADSWKGADLAFSIHGSGDIELSDVSLADIQASIHGSGDIKLQGSAQSVKGKTFGSGKIRSAELKTSRIEINN